jgi:hypothetical protein
MAAADRDRLGSDQRISDVAQVDELIQEGRQQQLETSPRVSRITRSLLGLSTVSSRMCSRWSRQRVTLLQANGPVIAGSGHWMDCNRALRD